MKSAKEIKYEDIPKVYRDNFYNRFKPYNLDKCWEVKVNKGQRYPVRSLNGRHLLLHRVSYVIFNGDLPSGKIICHKCDNTNCVNPSHLFMGTQIDNVRDMILKGRDRPGNRGVTSCKRGHEFDVNNTVWYLDKLTGKNKRYCKSCEKLRDKIKIKKRKLMRKVI